MKNKFFIFLYFSTCLFICGNLISLNTYATSYNNNPMNIPSSIPTNNETKEQKVNFDIKNATVENIQKGVEEIAKAKGITNTNSINIVIDENNNTGTVLIGEEKYLLNKAYNNGNTKISLYEENSIVNPLSPNANFYIDLNGNVSNITTKKVSNDGTVTTTSKANTNKNVATFETTKNKDGQVIQQKVISETGQVTKETVYDYDKNAVTTKTLNDNTVRTFTLDDKGEVVIGAGYKENKDGEVTHFYFTDTNSGDSKYITDEISKNYIYEIKHSIEGSNNKTVADVLETIKETSNKLGSLTNINISNTNNVEDFEKVYNQRAAYYNLLYEVLAKVDKGSEPYASYFKEHTKELEEIKKLKENLYGDLFNYFEYYLDGKNPNAELPIDNTQNQNGQGQVPNGTKIENPGSENIENTEKLEDDIKNLQENVENNDFLEPEKVEEEIGPEEEPQEDTTPEDPTDNDDEEQAKIDEEITKLLDELLQNSEYNYNEDTFKGIGLSTRQGETVGDSSWRYYISTELEIVSEVTDYATFGLTGLLNSNINTSTDGLGTKTAYSYVYDIDGNILKDSVAKSTQTAMAIASDNVVGDYAFIRLIGEGNEQDYNTNGYATVTLDGNENSQLSFKLIISGNRKKSDKESTVNVNSTTNSSTPDTVKVITKKLADIMYDTNKQSFIISNAGTIVVESPKDEYKVVSVEGEGHYRYYDEIFEDGFRRTWSYPEDQILIKNDGTRYAIVDVLRFDMYSISDLINHGFVCKLNGNTANPEDASDITSKPSDLEKGQESDETGVLKDNDSEHVIPEDGIDREPTFISDGTADLDLENAYSEYIYSSNNYDYYIPEGVNENTKLLLTDKDGNNKTLTIAEALAQKYINADEFVESMGKIGVEVVKIAKTSTTPDFQISIKPEENADTTLTKIFRDNVYSYSVAGSTLPNRVVIITADGRKLKLKYVLEHNMYTIEQLQDKGLTIYKSIINDTNEESKEEDNNNNNDKDKEQNENQGQKVLDFVVTLFKFPTQSDKLITSVEELNDLISNRKSNVDLGKYNKEFFETKSIYVISKEYNTGGYATNITNIKRENNEIIIYATTNIPAPDAIVSMGKENQTFFVELNKVDIENCKIKVVDSETKNEINTELLYTIYEQMFQTKDGQLITTTQEMIDFKNNLNINSANPLTKNINLDNLNGYDDDFFKTKSVYVISKSFESSGYYFHVNNIKRVNDTIIIYTETEAPNPNKVNALGERNFKTFFIELNKEDIANKTIKVENKDINISLTNSNIRYKVSDFTPLGDINQAFLVKNWKEFSELTNRRGQNISETSNYDKEFFKDNCLFIISKSYRTGGYSFSISNVEKVNGIIKIYEENKSPSPTDIVTQAITYKAVAIELNKNDIENDKIEVISKGNDAIGEIGGTIRQIGE